jgi:hypothetical protein
VLLDKYTRLALVVDEVINEGLLETTDIDTIRKATKNKVRAWPHSKQLLYTPAVLHPSPVPIFYAAGDVGMKLVLLSVLMKKNAARYSSSGPSRARHLGLHMFTLLTLSASCEAGHCHPSFS